MSGPVQQDCSTALEGWTTCLQWPLDLSDKILMRLIRAQGVASHWFVLKCWCRYSFDCDLRSDDMVGVHRISLCAGDKLRMRGGRRVSYVLLALLWIYSLRLLFETC